MKGPKKYKKQNKRKYDFPIEKSVEHAKLEYCEERMGLDLEDLYLIILVNGLMGGILIKNKLFYLGEFFSPRFSII